MKNSNYNFKSIVQSNARWLLTLLAILTLGVGQMRAYEATIFFAPGEIDAAWDSWTECWVNVNHGNWVNYEMDNTGLTYNGHTLYYKHYTDGNQDKAWTIEFHKEQNEWLGRKALDNVETNSSVFNNKLWNGSSWVDVKYIYGDGDGNWLNGQLWVSDAVSNSIIKGTTRTYTSCAPGLKSFRLTGSSTLGYSNINECNVPYYTNEHNNICFSTVATADITIGYDDSGISINVTYADLASTLNDILNNQKIMFYYGDNWSVDCAKYLHTTNSPRDNHYSSVSIHLNDRRLAIAIVEPDVRYWVANDGSWAGLQMTQVAKKGGRYTLYSDNGDRLDESNGELPSWTTSAATIAKGTTNSGLAATCNNSVIGRSHTYSYYYTQDADNGSASWNEFNPASAASLAVGEYTVRALAHDGNIYVRTESAATLTVYAAITLNNHGATSAGTTSVNAVLGSTAADISVPSKTGYTFNGYYTGENGAGTKVINANGSWVSNNSGYTDNSSPCKYDATANHELHAYWTEDDHTVTVNATAGGSVASASVTGHYETNVTLPTATADPGYYFTGWTTTDGSVTYTNQSSATSAQVNGLTAAATVQANFLPIWRVAYSGDSYYTDNHQITTITTSAGVMTSGSVTIDLNANTDYAFKIFNKQADHWWGHVGDVTKITYANQATAQSLSDDNTGNDQTFHTAGKGTYTFTWNVSSSEITITYPTSYTVTFGEGTGYGAAVTASVESSGAINSGDYAAAGKDITFTQSAATGYSFAGWYDASTGGSAVATMGVGDNVLDDIGANATVYSRYTENKSTITVSAGTGGTVTTGSGEHSLGVATTQAINASANPGYTWSTWTTTGVARLTDAATSASNTATTDGTNGGTGTITATFTANTYYVAFNANGGTGSMSNESFTYDADAKALTTNTFTRSHYTFAGWNTKADGSGDPYTDEQKVSNLATSGTLALYAQWTEITHDVSASASPVAGGTVTPTSATAMGEDNGGDITASANTGYTFSAWSIASGSGDFGASGTATTSTTANTKFRPLANATLTATFTAHTYSVRFNANSGSGSMDNQAFTYDAAQNLTACAFTKTGYSFGGWATSQANADAGTKAYDNEESVSNLASAQGAVVDLYAIWTANPYTVTLNVDEANKGTIAEATTSQDVTYDDATITVPNLPTAANGYCFMGFYTATAGGGTKLINADGTWIASVAGYTDGSANWKYTGNVTLYAYYQKAEITNIAFTGGAVAPPSTSKTVTATISPTPTGTTTVCWRILYSNDNPLDPQPAFSPSAQGTSVSFTSPAEGGAYKVEAVLRTGSLCGGGTTLDSVTANFQVATEHNVTVLYKCGSDIIAASTSMTGKPLEWTSITAPDIFGYTFDHWVAGDGITLSEDGEDELGEDESEEETIYIRAVYDGRLTAVYDKKKLIFLDLSQTFSLSGKWNNPYAYFYTSAGYWDSSKGAGATGAACVGKGAMTNIEGTDIWYYDYGSVSNFGNIIAFTWDDHLTAVNFSSTDVIYRSDFSEGTPLFVPHVGQTPEEKNTPSAKYYEAGYWVTYLGEKTGYTLRIKNSSTHELIKEVPFTSETKRMSMEAVTDLEASHTYEFEVMRDNGKYYKNNGSMTYSSRNGNWEFTEAKSIGTIVTTASGDYTFTLSFADNNNDENYQLRVNVKYPVATNDYRLIYKDDVHTAFKPSAVVANKPGGTDIVSFFVRPNSNPILYKQTASVAGDGTITWATTATNLITADMKSAVITKDSVYNFNLVMDEGGNLSVGSVEAYTGNFYIRTDGANNKWDNYTNADHMMTYSEYSEKNAGYSHYFMAFVENNVNVKFVVANDYSPCISDTLVQGSESALMDASGFIYERANVRFMWNRHDNSLRRAYLAAAKDDGTKFLVLRANSSSDMMDKDGNALINSANSGQAGYNRKAPDNSIQFVDTENWIYETNVKIKPSAYVKLYAHYHSADHYFKGENNGTFDGSNAIQLMTGTGEPELVRVIYDFKTDRLLAALEPSGNIDAEQAINADVMFVREHQGDIKQLTFSENALTEEMGAITEIKTAYAVMRFNKWTLNNKSKEGGHAVLDPLLSRYERDLFYVSFPFRVSMNEVFGFGTYGKHWIIEYYDGEARAANGFWAETASYWRYVTDRRGKFFEPNQGYIIALDLDELGEDSEVWNNNVQNVELYFPSYGTMGDITNATVEMTIPEHTCTIGPRFVGGDDRRVKDSHWNVMSVPTYVNTSSVDFANTTWTATKPSFLYEWNPSDNSLTPRSGTGYTYHAMHAYIVQYAGKVTWTSTSVTPSSVVARERKAPSEVEFRLELSQNDRIMDQTFVKLSDDEEVSTEFVFGEDMSKEFHKSNSNIYTMVSTMIDGDLSVTETAGNTLPMTEQTTLVPVGVKIATDGDYTFAIPEGTNGVGVTLIDNETGIRTSLSALDYTVNLSAGTYNGRFELEISPIVQTPTDVENVQSDNVQGTNVRKVLIDNMLYIVKDGKMYDARGARVE